MRNKENRLVFTEQVEIKDNDLKAALLEIRKARKSMKCKGFDSFTLDLEYYGSYAEDGQYMVLTGTRTESEDEFIERIAKMALDFEKRSKISKNAWAKRKAAT